MKTTLSAEFDPKTLPTWAQNNPAILNKCRNDLAFRIEVIDRGNDPMWRRRIESRIEEERNR